MFSAKHKGVHALGRLVVISNRVQHSITEPAAGGLAVAVNSALKHESGIWFGWSGQSSGLDTPAPTQFTTRNNITYALCDLNDGDIEDYYEGFANGVLWPLFHYRLDLMRYSRTQAEGYYRVNRLFAQRISEFVQEDDTLWVHDYHLLPLAKELRAKGIMNKVGFFMHISWPPYDVFSALPNAKQILQDMLEYSVIGFQTENDRMNFEEALARKNLQQRDMTGTTTTPIIRAFPIGIATAEFAALAKSSASSKAVQRIARSFSDRSLVIGVDRLDYSKGLLNKFEGFKEFLDQNPDYSDEATLLQITPKSRDAVKTYADLGREVARRAGQINGTLASIDWTPIRYVNRPYSQRALAGLYRMAKVALVTPLRDGMNLVAKEYVAAQDPEHPGVLILSKFAGCAIELKDAILVNPYDQDEIASALSQALRMSMAERKERYTKMMDIISHNTIYKWGEDFVQALKTA